SAEADASACYKYLLEKDFGFVHQVLSYERDRHVRTTTRSKSLNTYISAHISDLLEYGGKYLTTDERAARLNELMREYYEFLAYSALTFREREFWIYHRERLRTLGCPLNVFRLSTAITLKLLDLLLNPKRTVEIFVARLRRS